LLDYILFKKLLVLNFEISVLDLFVKSICTAEIGTTNEKLYLIREFVEVVDDDNQRSRDEEYDMQNGNHELD